MIYKNFLKPLLFGKDAEEAHEMAIKLATKTSESSLLQMLTKTIYGNNLEKNKELFGLSFKNQVGLAAGFDKNGTTHKAMEALGFGFIEVGSITAKASSGNPKPRAFRLPEDKSLINRMGLNNEGTDAIIDRLKRVDLDIPLGINIAKTNDASIHGKDAIADYLYSYQKAQEVADYITINISCPNTGEGKTFEEPSALKELLSGLGFEEKKVPTLVKFSVDTSEVVLKELISICEKFDIDGYIATNTSSARDNLKTNSQTLSDIGNGGLSGAAISEKSDLVVSWIYDELKGSKPIIGVGGIDSIESAKRKVDSGADLIQIYTGLIYEGPGLIKKLVTSL